MKNQEIVAKLWTLCNALRDSGITYHQYVTELTYVLFLKMARETGGDGQIPVEYRWDALVKKHGIELKRFYKDLLNHLGGNCTGRIREIYAGARSNIYEPKNLEKMIANVNALDWYTAMEEGLGNLYESLLEKSANEFGIGQHFTPRVLIDIMVALIAPQPGDRCNDPACGSFGFMIAADRYVKEQTHSYFDLKIDQQEFQKKQAFSGCELVHDTYRLALMNAMLHGIEGKILSADTLSNQGKQMSGFDVVLTNPPVGAKKGGERVTRDDLTFPASNRQLNFLQHIYRSLKKDGKARAAVVLPDNVLFTDGDGAKIRADLMDKCDLHTVLRLPVGILYAQGIKASVLFFTRGKTERGNTKEVWFYDLRTNMRSLGKNEPIKHEHFDAFVAAYNANDRAAVADERWNHFTREQIAAKSDNLDLGLIRDDSALNYDNQQGYAKSGEEIAVHLDEAVDLIINALEELKNLESRR